MPIAKITGQGLIAITLSVALLWICVFANHQIARRAYAERFQVLRQLEQLQRRLRPEPVSVPVPRPSHAPRPVIG